MKKIVFTLGAISAVGACGLVIDPDKLVEGNGAADPEAGTADTGGDDGAITTDSGSDVVIDAPADGSVFVEVPECVPAAPAGTQGPYAVLFATAPATPTCPAGYVGTPAAIAQGKLTAEKVVCGSTTGCSCGLASGAPTCGLRVSYYNEATCDNALDFDSLSGNCRDIDGLPYVKVVPVVSGVSCPNSGPATIAPTAKPAPAFAESWVVCEPDPNVKLAQCKMDQVAVPPAKDAGACVIVTGPSCPSPYTKRIDVSKSGTFTDGRACACSCSGSASSCSGGTATIFSDDSCLGGKSAPFPIDACTLRGNFDGMTGTPGTPGTPSCTAKASPTGSLSPNNDLHLCCLP